MGRIIYQWQCTPIDCGTTSTYFAYTYDLLGDLITSYNNTDNITYTNAYNGAAELTSVQSSLDDSQHPGTLVTLSNFTAFQKPQQINYGNGVETSLGYNTRLWLYFSNQGTPYDYNIISPSSTTGYAPNGDILYANDSVNGVWSYAYDDFNRLTIASCNTTYTCPAAAGVTYTYDRFGNRHSETVTTGSGVQPEYVFNANNQVVGNNTYDAAGNVIDDGPGLGNSYTYDAENRIISAGNGYTASYVYDAFGHRVRSTVNGQTRDFLYDLSGRTIDQITAGSLTRSEAYAGGKHIATYADSTTEFDSSDWLSTFRVRTNVSGGVVESCTSMPFGEDLTCTVPLSSEVSPLHFTGKERDTESGNDYFGARYYASSMGRMLSPDPVFATIDRVADPQQWNMYAYARNNPLSITDPTGLDFNLTCSGGNTAICQNGLQGQTTTDANGKSTFAATDVDMNDPSNAGAGYHDQFGNQYTGSFDQNSGVSFTNTATGDTSSNSRFIDGSDQTNVNGSGAFNGIQGQFNSNCGGSCEAKGSLYNLPGHDGAVANLEKMIGKSFEDNLNFFGGHGKSISFRFGDDQLTHIVNHLGGPDAGKQEVHFEGHAPGRDLTNFVLHLVDAIRDSANHQSAQEPRLP